MIEIRVSMRGKNKRGKAGHQTFDRSNKKVADSHHNGWLSGLRNSLKRGTITKEQYEDAVMAWNMFSSSGTTKTYNIVQWWKR